MAIPPLQPGACPANTVAPSAHALSRINTAHVARIDLGIAGEAEDIVARISRRGLLGGLVATAALAVPASAGPRSVDTADWDRARDIADQARERSHAYGDTDDTLWDARTDAEIAAFQIPAPHVVALAWKLERLFGPEQRDAEGFGDAWGPVLLNPIMADVRRLSGEAGA